MKDDIALVVAVSWHAMASEAIEFRWSSCGQCCSRGSLQAWPWLCGPLNRLDSDRIEICPCITSLLFILISAMGRRLLLCARLQMDFCQDQRSRGRFPHVTELQDREGAPTSDPRFLRLGYRLEALGETKGEKNPSSVAGRLRQALPLLSTEIKRNAILFSQLQGTACLPAVSHRIHCIVGYTCSFQIHPILS